MKPKLQIGNVIMIAPTLDVNGQLTQSFEHLQPGTIILQLWYNDL